MSADQKKFYLTTPIYYVNARPHIGHAYTTIVADVLARRHRLLGDDTFFLTGTDEHGQKIERSAAAAGVAPQQFADEVSDAFQSLWKRMGLTYDKFIRTTDPEHKRGVQKLFTELYERGFIYLASYTGSYCVSDEAFVDAPPGTPCPDCGRLLETVTEENFFFKLSEFQRPLIDLIESDTLAITPETRKNEVLSFLRGNWFDALFDDESLGANLDVMQAEEKAVEIGTIARSNDEKNYLPGALKDLSISRSSFAWGIPVPPQVQEQQGTKQKHVIYVWLDALANYMTGVGYGSEDAEFKRFWPADLHLVGKEIIRFHCIYWPAFLLALNPELQHDRKQAPPQLSFEEHRKWAEDWLPKAVTAHGWLLFDNAKMSKSKGNIVRAETILEAFGEHVYAKQFPDSTKRERDLFATDVLRYFLLREIPFGQDGSFSFDAMVTRYNADLANGYGNLVSRTLSMIEKYSAGQIADALPFDSALCEILLGDLDDYDRRKQREELTFSEGSAWAFESIEDRIFALFEKSEFGKVLFEIFQIVSRLDAYLTQAAPWKLKDNAEYRARVLVTAVTVINFLTDQLHAVIPHATQQIWQQIGFSKEEISSFQSASGEFTEYGVPLNRGDLRGRKLGPLAPIFPRADKGLAQIMIDMEENNSTTAASKKPQSDPAASTHPVAPPRALDGPSGTLAIGGSSAEKPALPTTPGAHHEAVASGPFAAAAAQVPVNAAPTDALPQITIDDFAKIDLRVAEILVAERIPKADKLLRLEVDLGYEKRQILSGIAQWYTPEELIGRRIVVITNLAPRKMRGLESHGMLLAASEGEGGKPVLATFGENIAVGSRLK